MPIVDYKHGVKLVSPDPIGRGGKMLLDNDKALADAIDNAVQSLIDQSTFVYTQGAAAMVWEFDHNLGKYPSVQTFEDLGSDGLREVEGLVEHLSLNRVRVSFNVTMSGKVTCN